jgi:hypothetical protein
MACAPRTDTHETLAEDAAIPHPSSLKSGTIEHAQQIAAHESPRTTKLYGRTCDEILLVEIERIVI